LSIVQLLNQKGNPFGAFHEFSIQLAKVFDAFIFKPESKPGNMIPTEELIKTKTLKSLQSLR